jgi:hypothetical protein
MEDDDDDYRTLIRRDTLGMAAYLFDEGTEEE